MRRRRDSPRTDGDARREGWLGDGLFAVALILTLAAIAALRPAVRRRAAVLLLPALLTTTLACWGFRGYVPAGPPIGLLSLSPFHWQVFVLVPVIGVGASFICLQLYERLLRPREPGKPAFPRPGGNRAAATRTPG